MGEKMTPDTPVMVKSGRKATPMMSVENIIGPPTSAAEPRMRAFIDPLPSMPPDDVVARLVTTGQYDVFAANRQRVTTIARRFRTVKVLADNFMTIDQAIVLDKGSPNMDELNRFVADVRSSGFVKASLESAQITGVEVAPAPPAKR